MRRLLGAALVLAVLAALGLGAALLLLPRLVAGDAARARIESAAEAALGRALRYQRLDVGLLPPSVVVVEPAIAGDTPEAPPLVDARRISLRIALLPLLARKLLVDGLVVDGATLRLRRTAAGLELPGLRAPEAAGAGDAAPATDSADEPPPLAVRRLALRRSTLILEDAAVEPPVTWELRELRAKLRGDSLGEPLDVDASFELASGGRVKAEGTVTLAGEVDLDLALEEVALAPVASYLEGGASVAGLVSGSLELEGPLRSPSRVVAKLAFRDADLRLDEIALRGPLRLEADLTRASGAPSGRFEIDATGAELVYGGAFRKPPGTSATVSGRIVSGPGGTLGFDDLKLRVRDLDATAALHGGPRMRIDVHAPPFDLAGWEALLPALARWQLGGRVAPDGIAIEQAPRELHGRLALDGVRATSSHGGVLVLRGALVGEGARVRGEALELLAADQPFRVDAELADLDSPAPRWQLRFEGHDADVNRLLGGFGGRRDALHGRLAISGDLGLPIDTGGDPLTALSGRVRLEIRDGRTKGRSVLKTSLDALTAVARPLHLLSRGFETRSGGGDGDHFESITGSFEIADGIARTDDLRIVEREHSIDLSGTLRFSDLALDMRGNLSFVRDDGGGPGSERPGIPVARVRGTLGNPDVEVTAEAARSFAAALEPSRLGKKLGRALDPETARELADGLGGLLQKAVPKR
ncbi:MAG: AsmA-like C-terminal region-containing protein [Candidatus Limnocylindria bacterium]